MTTIGTTSTQKSSSKLNTPSITTANSPALPNPNQPTTSLSPWWHASIKSKALKFWAKSKKTASPTMILQRPITSMMISECQNCPWIQTDLKKENSKLTPSRSFRKMWNRTQLSMYKYQMSNANSNCLRLWMKTHTTKETSYKVISLDCQKL